MAAFSSHHRHHCPPFMAPELGDVPNTSKEMSDLLEQGIMKTSTGFSSIYLSKLYPPLQFHSIQAISCGSIDHSISKAPLSYAHCGLTPKQYTYSSSMVAELQSTMSADQATLALTHLEKKRKKSMDSKVVREDQCKKLDKRCEDGMSRKGEEKKFKARRNEEEEEEEEEKKKKVPKEPPTGCVHVRARRGQATDSHSLAERARREKISERMRLLQSLVPGCDKITGKALILDEIINYVQSLKNQVEFLVMKLDAVSLMSSDLDDNVSASEFCKPEPPLPSVPQYNPMKLGVGTSIPETTPISTSFLHHDGQISTFLSQDDDGDLLGDLIIDDQRQMLIANHSGLNNLCYF